MIKNQTTLSQAAVMRKVQRLSRKGVGNSVPEARGVHLTVDHDIVCAFRRLKESDRKRVTRNRRHKYIINNDLATPAANQYTMLFGDMSTFKLRKVASGTTILRLVERYADFTRWLADCFAPAITDSLSLA